MTVSHLFNGLLAPFQGAILAIETSFLFSFHSHVDWKKAQRKS